MEEARFSVKKHYHDFKIGRGKVPKQQEENRLNKIQAKQQQELKMANEKQ